MSKINTFFSDTCEWLKYPETISHGDNNLRKPGRAIPRLARRQLDTSPSLDEIYAAVHDLLENVGGSAVLSPSKSFLGRRTLDQRPLRCPTTCFTPLIARCYQRSSCMPGEKTTRYAYIFGHF